MTICKTWTTSWIIVVLLIETVNIVDGWMIVSNNKASLLNLSRKTLKVTTTAKICRSTGHTALFVNNKSDNNNENENEDEEETSSSFYFVDEDCVDLCTDIDYDEIMTKFDNDDDDENDEKDDREEEINNNKKQVSQQHEKEEEIVKATTTTTTATVDEDSITSVNGRTRLEMFWGLNENNDDCDIEQIDTCGDPCPTCNGSGYTLCRFCHGKTMIFLPNAKGPMVCNVCSHSHRKGLEQCKDCCGSGYVASWTGSGGPSASGTTINL